MSDNVRALTEIMRRFRVPDGKASDPWPDLPAIIADYLALSGVLAVEALTDDQIELEIWPDGTRYKSPSLPGEPDFAVPHAPGLRDALRAAASQRGSEP